MKEEKIKSIISNLVWHIKCRSPLSEEDRRYIMTFDPIIYHNDLECYLWAFDEKLPSGRWLENMRFEYDLRNCTALVY